MKTIAEHDKLYFMGICGTAMGSVAAAFADAGYQVLGSDANVYDPMKSFLEGKGVDILDGYREENVATEDALFVIGNAQSRGNAEVEAVLRSKRPYVSLPELLRTTVLRGQSNILVSGTHGKTTTSSLLAWIFESAGRNPSFMIGGIPGNLGQGARFVESEHTILEADEYDSAFFDKRSKFIHYLPEVAIVNNLEFDHADIFDDLKAVEKTFGHMVRLVPDNGLILANGDQDTCRRVVEAEGHAPVCFVGLDAANDRQITEIHYQAAGTNFCLAGDAYSIPLLGEFNVRNAAMAISAALHAGIEPADVQTALDSFEGIRRRQEERGTTARGITVVDDFAHHPTAIGQAIDALRVRYEGRRLWAIFEPRSNTMRRNVFQDQLPAALAKADGVCLSAIEDTKNLTESEQLDVASVLSALAAEEVPVFLEPSADQIVERLESEVQDDDVLVVLSNGGFGGIHEKLLSAFA